MVELIDIVLPQDQQEGTQSFVGSWLKKVGDSVKQHEPILEVSTDKVTLEVSAPASGVLTEVLKSKGDEVHPGEVLGRITLSSLSAATDSALGASRPLQHSQHKANSDAASAELSAAVRRLLKEHGIEANALIGTGKGGRITQEDVLAYVKLQGEAAGTANLAPRASSKLLSSRRIPHEPMRRHIAAHMVQSLLHTAPHVTTVFDCNLSAVIAHRESLRSDFEKRGVKLTLTSYFVRAAAQALKAVPEVNSRWHDDALEIFDDANIGIATALETHGLIVPVIQGAQRLDLFETARTLQDLTERARNNALKQEEVQNGTFTISNHGVSGSLFATPIIINQPQSAILGIGKMEKRAAVIDGDTEELKFLPKAYVTLTIDHRALDGYQANKFLSAFVAALEAGVF